MWNCWGSRVILCGLSLSHNIVASGIHLKREVWYLERDFCGDGGHLRHRCSREGFEFFSKM
jgi:hypothetical protein